MSHYYILERVAERNWFDFYPDTPQYTYYNHKRRYYYFPGQVLKEVGVDIAEYDDSVQSLPPTDFSDDLSGLEGYIMAIHWDCVRGASYGQAYLNHSWKWDSIEEGYKV